MVRFEKEPKYSQIPKSKFLEPKVYFGAKSGQFGTKNPQSGNTEGKAPNAMIEITVNDRLGKKVRVKCNEDDTVGDLKKLIAAQTGTRWDKIVLKKWYTIYKDHIRLEDYEIHDGMNLELYYQ